MLSKCTKLQPPGQFKTVENSLRKGISGVGAAWEGLTNKNARKKAEELKST